MPTDPTPTPTPREAVIRALHEAGAWCGQCDYESDETCPDCKAVLAKYADACLAALAATGDAPTWPYPPDTGRTHYDGCWRERGHHNCAVAQVDTLTAQHDRFVKENVALRAERDALRARVAALEGMVGAETGREHERGCPGLQAWDVPGACSCSYPEVTRCRGCGTRLRRGTPDWRDDATPARPTDTGREG